MRRFSIFEFRFRFRFRLFLDWNCNIYEVVVHGIGIHYFRLENEQVLKVVMSNLEINVKKSLKSVVKIIYVQLRLCAIVCFIFDSKNVLLKNLLFKICIILYKYPIRIRQFFFIKYIIFSKMSYCT